MDAPILEVSHITKAFRQPFSLSSILRPKDAPQAPTAALKDVSFSLTQGKILGVLGPNGAGKTTLLKIISTLILPEKGRVTVDGYRLGRDDEKIKSVIGMALDEERSFYWRLSGRQNLDFFATLYGLNKHSAQKRINELLELFEIDYADKRFDSYSTGMKRRFSLARSLIHNPEIILLDEPTQSLDYPTAFHLRSFVREKLVRAQGKTVLFTTHHMDEAIDFADLFLILHKGTIRGIGTLNELRKLANNPSASLGEIFLGLVKKRGQATFCDKLFFRDKIC